MSEVDKLLDDHEKSQRQAAGQPSPAPKQRTAVDDLVDAAPDTKVGLGRSVADTGVALGASLLTGGQLIANVGGADNSVAQGLGRASDYVRGFESAGRREERERRSRKIEEAEQSGSTMREIGAHLGAFAEAPIDTTVEAIGTSAPTLLAAALARGRGGVSVPATMGAAQGAGAVKGSIYEQVEQEYLKAGASPEEAAARAAQAQSYDGGNAGQIAIGAGLGAVAGSTGIESAVGRMLGREAGEAAARGVARSAAIGAAAEAPIEALQGGQERLAGNIATQNEGFDTPLWQGVAGSAALEGVAGGAAGGGFGAVEGFMARQPAADPLTDIPADDPMAGAGEPVPEVPPAAPGMAPAPVPEQYRRETLGDDPVQPAADTPAPMVEPTRAPTPSEQMGIDPNAGPLSAAAAIAVDTGTTDQLAQQAALQQAAEVAEQAQKKGGRKRKPEPAPEGVNTETGEIMQQGSLLSDDPARQLQERMDFLRQQGRITGWTKKMLREREAVKARMDELGITPAPREQAQSRAEDAAAQTLARGGNEAEAARAATDTLIDGMEAAPDIEIASDAPAAVAAARARTQGTEAQAADEKSADDIKAITRKQIPKMTDAEIEQAITHYGPKHKRTAKLQKELAKRRAEQQQPEEVSATPTQDTGDQGQPQTATQADAQTSQQQADVAGAAAAPAEAAPTNLKDAIARVREKKKPKQPAMPRQDFVSTAGVGEVSAVKERYGDKFGVSWASTNIAEASTMEEAAAIAQAVAESGADNIADMRSVARRHTDDRKAAAAETAAQIDTAANVAATSPQSARPEPTEAQKEAGNYAKGHVRVQGMDITVENPRGSERSGTDPDGNEWRHTMSDHYGYIKRTTGADGDQVDAYIGPNPESKQVFVVDQIDQQTDGFDEHKVMIGFDREADAVAAYRSNFDEGWKVGPVRAMSMDEFKGWLRDGDTTKPAAAHEQSAPASGVDRDVSEARADAEALQALVEQASSKNQAWMDDIQRRAREAFANGEPITPPKDAGSGVGAIVWRDAWKAAKAEAAKPETDPAPPKGGKKADQFQDNKLFTSDKVAAARARMRSKLGQLNSGIDPEMLVDGMTIAGAYIESGVRSFTQYAQSMIEDLGDGVKPYLLSFWEGARNYPGLNTEGMTDPAESARQHQALLAPADVATEAVGTVAKKPRARTRKTGARGDMVLTQDWGVEHIDGYGDSDRETGNDTKDAFLKEARKYLNAVADALRSYGYEPHLDRKGKPERPVSVNESGVAGSGDVTLTMHNPETGNNVYIHIGDSALRGVVPTTPSGIAVMYRVGDGADRYAARSGNTWAPVDLSANELAQQINSRVHPAQSEARDERPADGAPDQGRAQEVRGGGSAAQPGSASADTGDVAARQPADGEASGETESAGRPGVREPGADVAPVEGAAQGRAAGDGRARAGRARVSDAGAGNARAERAEDGAGSRGGDAAPVASPAATSVQAQDLHIDNPLDIVGGTPVQRFNRNRQALELLQQLEEEGRQATLGEQKILAGYIGWGSFGQELFQGTWERPVYRDEGVWKERGEWLRETLGESAWKSAQRSITNAHYTDPPTVMAMWDMVRRMGFTGGKVLEPSLGTGNFFSMMPADIKARSQLTGIELDETTGAIAKQLFPKSNVRIMGYQDSKTPDGFYDLVIGNWPFENTPVADRRYNKLNPMLHDYFFLKALDQVRPGGIVIGITSAGSMDKQNTMIRREMARKSELVASIRLPSGAFEEYAGTKVVTDIVILRKRPERLVAVPSDATWVETGVFQTPSGEKVRVNQHYLDNPQHIIGTLDYGHGTTTFRAGMIVHRPDNMAERLRQAVELVPENAMQPAATVDHLTYYANETGERHGSLAVINDQLMIAMGDQMVMARDRLKYELKDAKKTADREKQLRDIVELRRLHSALVDTERRGDEAKTQRRALKQGYERFVSDHGKLRDSFALTYLERIEDPFFAELAALENDDGTPAAVMARSTTRSKRQIENPNIRDAYVLARNQAITPSVDDIARIAGKSAEEVKAELLKSGAVFESPTGDIVPSDIYLSGNVREKMREAIAALEEGNTAMQANIDALQEVMPEDVPYFNIETKLGATWVPSEAYAGYIAHMLGRSDTQGIEVSFRSGRWKVKLDHALNAAAEASANYGTPHYSFSRLVQAALSNQVLRLRSKDRDGNEYYDAEKSEEVNSRLAKMREDFGAWLWSDPERRVDLEREYNESRNAWATPRYDGSFLTFEGMALTLGKGEFNLREHQANAIWRAIVNRRSINAHEVGTGKTFTMGGIAIESRRYGIARKPVILAHNANSATVAKEIRMMYPSARVLYVDNLEPKSRDIRLRQIANDDWDAIVIPHSLIGRLSLREETLMQMAADDIAALEAEFFDAAAEDGISTQDIDLDSDEDIGKIRSVTAKELAKARKRIIESIKKQGQQASKEGAVTFEDLGIDMILVDEVHEFKKPPIVTRMQMKGLNTGVSNRSIALQFLTRYVRQMNNGGNVHTFTGTPITNTITEIYHQMRYVMESEMEQANVADWDGWFGSFATEVQDVELSAAGDYEMVTRLAGFVNVPELRQMVGQYMDTVFADDMPEMQPRKTKSGKRMGDDLSEAERAELLNGRTEGAADRPYKKVINESSDMTVEQQRIFRELQGYAQDWRNATGKQRREWQHEGDPRSPIITEGIANKASFDVRLLDESLAGMEGKTNDDPNSKASRVVANTLDIYNSHPLANQVIFAEMGFSKSIRRTRTVGDEKVSHTVKVFSTVHDIVERLVQGGIPREQIAIVDGKVSKEKRSEIAEAMNDGRIRVVIGSTDTLGVGVNMQRNLRAMHHLDAPYMPGELEQRNGRGQRQGNQWNTVLEYRYMTDRLDGRRWQILAVKQRFITAFMKANTTTRVIEGEAAADQQSDILESFSEAAGDPRVLQRVKLQKKVESLQRKERLYTQGIADMRRQIRYSEGEVKRLTREIDAVDTDAVAGLLQEQRDNFTATIDGTTYDARKDAVAALEDYLTENMRVGEKERHIGTYGGHPLLVEWSGLSDTPTTMVRVGKETFAGKGIAGIEASMRNLPRRVENMRQERETAESTIANMQQAMQQPFGQAEDLARTIKQLEDLEADLAINPVPPPAWLRQGAPIDSEVYRNKKPYIVTGHRYSQEGWFVMAEDDKGATVIPYMEVTDSVGMPVYEEREFVAPEVVSKDSPQGLTEADRVPEQGAPDIRRSFAGRRAATADPMALESAQLRIAGGENAETVRQETGWHRGNDGKWRFEISDDQATLKTAGATFGEAFGEAYANAFAEGRSTVTVGDLLQHDQLFSAYPALADIPVSEMPEGERALARLQRRATGMAVQVQPSMRRNAVASALLHELQHGIQTIEGFATGGSAKRFVSDMDRTGAKTYRRLAGEVEARNTQTRQRMTPEARQRYAPELTADVPASDVIVTFNGRDLINGPLPGNAETRPAMTQGQVVRAFQVQFPKLVPAVRTMLSRGADGKRGGLVLVDSADPLMIARAFSKKTGRALTDSVQMFSEAGSINGFYDPQSGLTFLVTPNLDAVTAPAVLLHEMVHGQQRKKIDARAGEMLMNRAKFKDPELRAFLDRVAARMVDAGEGANIEEAAPYIVEQAVIEGRSQGYALADSRFLSWVDKAVGQRVGDLIRSMLASIRSWMLRNGMKPGEITVDDLVGYAMAGVQRAAGGRVDGASATERFSATRDSGADDNLLHALINEFSYDGDARSEAISQVAHVSADSAFDPELIDDMRVPAYKSREKLIDMPIADFLALAREGREAEKAAGVKRLIESGTRFNSLPFLHIDRDGRVEGHEGRHRARALADQGYTTMPVILRMADLRWSEQTDPGRFDYIADWPTAIQAEVGAKNQDLRLPFPVTREQAMQPYRPALDGIRFSRSGLKHLASRATLELNRTFNAPGKLHWWHKTVGTMYNLAERSPEFKPVFEAAQGFIDDVAHYATDAAEMAPRLLPRLETWRDILRRPISADDNKAVSGPVFEGTLVWARDGSGKPVRVDELEAAAERMSTDEKVQALLHADKIPEGMLKAWQALPEDQFAKMIDSRYESQLMKPGVVWSDAELRSIFNLTDSQIELYREFRAAIDRSLDTMARADMLRYVGEDAKDLSDAVMDAADVQAASRILVSRLQEIAQNIPDRETQLMQLAHGVIERAARVGELQSEGYAPLSRFGKYTVDVVVDGERQYFGLFETRREANKMAEAMKSEFGANTVTQGTLSDESFKLFAGVTPETLELFGNMLGLDSTGDSAQDQAFQQYLRLTKTNRSAMRRLIHRKGVAGYSEDVGRVLASFVYSNARQTAAGLNIGELGEAVSQIPKEQGELKDAAVRLSEYIKNPQEEAQAMRGMLFAQYLGGSVASAFVNMTQPLQVTFPWLSQYAGARGSAKEIGRAVKQMSTRGYQYEADLAQALKDAEDDGTVSPQEVHQLMAQARGSGSLRAGDGTRAGEARAFTSNQVARLSLAWGKMFGAAEQANRRITFIAAYRVARDKGMPDPAAFARRAVQETQFVYSKAAKMQWGRGAIGGTLMTFKTYSVSYIELMHRLWNQGEPGSEERAEGRKAAMLMVATLMLMGGVGGLPFMEDAEDLIDGAAQLMGYNFSTRQAKEQFLRDVFGDAMGEFIEKGVSGLPGAPMDVSGRLGMGNLIPGTGLFTERTSHTRDVLEILGPGGDFANRILSGGRQILGGDVGAGLLEISPVAVRNVAKGVDMAVHDMYRDTKGYKVLDTNILEAALKAGGFQPASVAKIQEANWINQRAKNFYSMQAQEIRAMWATGIFEGDQAKVQRARDRVAEWNRKNPSQPMIIRIPDVMRRVREMRKTKDERIASTAPRAMRAQMREDLARVRSEL